MTKRNQKAKKLKAGKADDATPSEKGLKESPDSGKAKPIKDAPIKTPPKRPVDKRKEGDGSILRHVGKAGQFLREARMELKKVKWPTRKELLASTGVVIFLVLAVSFYLGLVDFGLIKLIKMIVG